MLKNFIRALGTGLFVFALGVPTAQATVVIGGTRVVFPAQDGEATVRLSNQGGQPALVEAWIDDGDAQSTPDKTNAPFLVTPPLFRMDGHSEQSLRIIATPASLAGDRETLFWLNVLEVPPKPAGDAPGNTLQFAVRSRLKLFYRPPHLPGDPLKAPAQLAWKVVADGQGLALEVRNPTPYYVTLSRVALQGGGASYEAAAGMVAPQGTLRLAVKGAGKAPAGAAVDFDSINDYGATATYRSTLTP